jgi:hypothetical protein
MRNVNLVTIAAIIIVVEATFTPPVSVVRAQGTRSVLFDESHSEYAGGALTDTTSKFGALAGELQKAGYTVDSLPTGPVTYDILSRYSVFAVLAPFTPPISFTGDEIGAVQRFVNNGGGLFIAALGWSWADYAKTNVSQDPANQLGALFGITVLNNVIHDPASNFGKDYQPIFRTFAPQPINTGLSAIEAEVPSALSVSGSAQVIVSGSPSAYTDDTPQTYPPGSNPPFAAVAESGLGKVVYAGHDGFFYGDFLYRVDNLKFAINIFNWLAGVPEWPPPTSTLISAYVNGVNLDTNNPVATVTVGTSVSGQIVVAETDHCWFCALPVVGINSWDRTYYSDLGMISGDGAPHQASFDFTFTAPSEPGTYYIAVYHRGCLSARDSVYGCYAQGDPREGVPGGGDDIWDMVYFKTWDNLLPGGNFTAGRAIKLVVTTNNQGIIPYLAGIVAIAAAVFLIRRRGRTKRQDVTRSYS